MRLKEATLEQVVEKYGRLDILSINAGVGGKRLETTNAMQSFGRYYD